MANRRRLSRGSAEVRSGVARIGEINGRTGEIIEEVDLLGSRFQQVNEGVRNQAVGAQQINEAMAQVTAAAQQTRASLEEFNRASAPRRGAVEALNQEIGQFTGQGRNGCFTMLVLTFRVLPLPEMAGAILAEVGHGAARSTADVPPRNKER
jgi:hypothetical protein